MFFSATSLFNGLRNQIKQTFNDVKTLDKAFGSIAMVTNETLKSMWGNYNQYNQMAKSLGQSTEGVIKASALFRQQGLDTADALSLTEDTMKLATLAGADFATATEEMTSAIRGFKMEMSEGAHVTDVYSELAAHAAASVDDIAQAMARTASIANSAGMSFENTSAFLT
jgi:TP901 family phage tail tape measure protein